jgi:hypothetical protein
MKSRKKSSSTPSISFINFRNWNKKRKGATPNRDTTRKTSKNRNTTSRTSTTSATIRPIKQGEKIISLCRHKLQGRTGHQSRRGRQQSKQHERKWLPESEADQQTEIDLLDEDTDPEWTQLREMEELLRLQRMELLRQGAPDLHSEDWDSPQWLEERDDLTDVEEDDSLEDADLAFITSILESFSKPKSEAVKHDNRRHLTSLIWSMRYLNTPLETDAGSVLQLNTWYPSKIYSFTRSRTNTTRTRFWEI